MEEAPVGAPRRGLVARPPCAEPGPGPCAPDEEEEEEEDLPTFPSRAARLEERLTRRARKGEAAGRGGAGRGGVMHWRR